MGYLEVCYLILLRLEIFLLCVIDFSLDSIVVISFRFVEIYRAVLMSLPEHSGKCVLYYTWVTCPASTGRPCQLACGEDLLHPCWFSVRSPIRCWAGDGVWVSPTVIVGLTILRLYCSVRSNTFEIFKCKIFLCKPSDCRKNVSIYAPHFYSEAHSAPRDTILRGNWGSESNSPLTIF